MAEGPPPEDFSKLPLEDKLSHKVRAAQTEVFEMFLITSPPLPSPISHSLRFPSLPATLSLLSSPFSYLFLLCVFFLTLPSSSSSSSPSLPSFPSFNLFHSSPSLFLLSATYLPPSPPSFSSLPLSPLSPTGLESSYDGLRRSG